MCPIFINFLINLSDHLIVSSVQELFEVMSTNETCMITLQQRLIPTLIGILNPNNGDVILSLHPVS